MVKVNVALPDGQLPYISSRKKIRHIPALDGLRGTAVVAVLLFHTGHLTGGYLGVDLFFVLSGYLITSLLVSEWSATGRVSLSAFWSRRARRLLPALLAVLVVVGLASHWFVPPVGRGQLRSDGLATLGYVANWSAIFRSTGYWQQTLLPSWLQHTWSLAIEEQFYLVWPLVVVVVLGRRRSSAEVSDAPPTRSGARRKVGRLAVLAWGGAVLSAALMIGLALIGVSSDRLYLGTDTRAAAIMMGAGLACVQWLSGADRPITPTLRRAIAVMGVAAGAVLATGWLALDGDGRLFYRGGLVMCGIAATVVLLDVTTPGTSPLQRLFSVVPLRWLGFISYGLYLWHWPIYQYLQPGRFGLFGWPLVAVRVGASVATAVVSYHLIEQPVRRGALRGSAARLATIFGAALAIVALLVGTTGAISPVPSFASDQVGYTPGSASMPRLVAVGDSVSLGLTSDGIVPQAQQLGVRVLNRAVVGCTIMRDKASASGLTKNCSPDWPKMIRHSRPAVVMVLFGLFAQGAFFETKDGRHSPCDLAWRLRWRERLNRAIDTLSADGAKVVLVSAPTTEAYYLKGADSALFDRQQECSNKALAQVAASRPEAGFVDLAHYVCPTGTTCRSTVNGTDLRPDSQHFMGPGAKLVARWLVPRVLAAAGKRSG